MSEPRMEAGRELDAEVAVALRWEPVEYDWRAIATKPESIGYDRLPHFSTDIAAAWDVVLEVQRQHPGWRFCLLGGDVSMGYVTDRCGKLARDDDRNLIVAEDSRFPFGWNAEFMGDEDPRLCTGRRHGDQRADTPAHAICLAALEAVAAVGEPQ